MTRHSRFAGRLALVAAALLLLACSPRPTATPLPPTATAPAAQPPPSPTTRLLPTATTTPAPTPDALAGWPTVETDLFTLRLPAGWQVMALSEADLAAMAAELEPYQQAIGWRLDPAEGAAGLHLVAMPVADGGPAHSLNVRHMSLGAQRYENAAALLAMFAPQLEILGFTVTEQRADLLTEDGLPMGRLSYTAGAAAKGQPMASGEQYYVLTEADLWVLTFASAGSQTPAAPAVFARSAKTFAPRK